METNFLQYAINILEILEFMDTNGLSHAFYVNSSDVNGNFLFFGAKAIFMNLISLVPNNVVLVLIFLFYGLQAGHWRSQCRHFLKQSTVFKGI